ncbi:hypothetical protein BH11MYX2_BH11MYX2_13810 [soil metagenome]
MIVARSATEDPLVQEIRQERQNRRPLIIGVVIGIIVVAIALALLARLA